MEHEYEKRVSTLEADAKNMHGWVQAIANDVKSIKDKLVNRPNWYITTTMAGMAGAIGWLLSVIYN